MWLPSVLYSSLFHIMNLMTHVSLTDIKTKCQKKENLKEQLEIKLSLLVKSDSDNIFCLIKTREASSDEIFVPKISCDILLYIYCILIVTTNLDNVYRGNKCK